MIKISTIFAISLAGLSLAACTQPRPIPSGSDTKFYGNITSGEKFGVSIGDARASAHAEMINAGYAFSGTATCSESGLKVEIGCGESDVFDFYHKHQNLGHNAIFFEIEEERVVRISWSFTLVQVDF